MRVVIDIECNALRNPTKIWCIVCKDIDTGTVYKFRNVHEDPKTCALFREFAGRVSLWIGHNYLGYDYPALNSILSFDIPDIAANCIDTLIVSKLVDYSRKGHSIEAYGEEFESPKGENTSLNFFKQWSQELEDYCVRDVDICERVYRKYIRYINTPERYQSILLEQQFQLLVNDLHNNGFGFNVVKCRKLLQKVEQELAKLDAALLEAFPPKLTLIKEVTPKVTQHGTLSRTDFRWKKDGDLSEFNGGPFSRCRWVDFNPASHKQRVAVLTEAGWKPEHKTETHLDREKELRRLKYQKHKDAVLDEQIKKCDNDLLELRKTGWKIDEHNLSTLPKNAPASAWTLAKRVLYGSRRNTLTEWLGLVQDDQRIHGAFYGIGAWTHRMATQRPNVQNIPREFHEDGTVKFLGKEMRQLWQAPKNRLLVGVDAEGIQLRVFAHYTQDKELIDAIVKGKKADKTDPHSFNKGVLGDPCKSRQAAKRFLYALFLGGGLGRLASILGCSEDAASDALGRLLKQYPGFQRVKDEIIPADARRGWFVGIDGRAVRIPGTSVSERRHLCMSGYLQNGEAVIMKKAAVLFNQDREIKELRKEHPILFVNLVHDEDQFETPNNLQIAVRVGEIAADKIRLAGEAFNLKCPMAGSLWNDDINDYTIGLTWFDTH